MEDTGGNFSVLDYIVFVSLLVISFGIGIATAFKGNKSPEEYLLGNRSLGAIPVAMSLLTSMLSAVNIVGFSAEVYMYGLQLSLISFGCIFGIAISILIVIPVTFPLRLTSIHEYVELRFHSPRLQLVMMCLIFFNANVFMGICLYATAIALAAVTPLSYQTFILIMGIVCTIYSTVGGIRAVVWTDVFQLIVMTVGLLIFIVAGVIRLGGMKKLLSISMEGNRIELFNMNPSLYERHSFYNTLAFGAFFYGAIFSVSQVNTQRISAVPTLYDAKKVLLINMFGMVVLHVIIFFGGLVAYGFYAGCDPVLEHKIQKRDEILSYMIVDKLGNLYGLPGIFVATLISSTLSTFSSVVNAQVALLWKDWLSKTRLFSNVNPKSSALITKILTFMIGGSFIGMAFLTAKAKSIVQLSMSVGGIIFGGIFGVFLLGMCVPTSNVKGAWSGLIGSVSFLIWIYIGSIIYSKPPEMLPITAELCDSQLLMNSSVYEFESLQILTDIQFIANKTDNLGFNLLKTDEESFSFPLMYLYGISYTLYSVIGPLLCISIGVIVSYLTGATGINEVNHDLISNIFLKLFWSRELKKQKKYELKPV